MGSVTASTTKPMLDVPQSSDSHSDSPSDSPCSTSPSPRSGGFYPNTPLKRLNVGPTALHQDHGNFSDFTFEDPSDSIMDTLVTYQQFSAGSQVSSPTASSDSISSSLRLVLSTSSWTSSSSSSQWSPSPVLPSSPSSLSSSVSPRPLPRRKKGKGRREAKGNLAVHPALFTSPNRSKHAGGTHLKVKPRPKKSPKDSPKDKSLSRLNKNPKSVGSKHSTRTKVKTRMTGLDVPNSSISAEAETAKEREVTEAGSSRLGSPNSWFVYLAPFYMYVYMYMCIQVLRCPLIPFQVSTHVPPPFSVLVPIHQLYMYAPTPNFSIPTMGPTRLS